MATLLKDVVPSPDQLMGVKAVWSRSREPVMCFGSRGNAALKDKAHFSQARNTAERAQTQPYFLTIGGGERVPAALSGRVLELVRATGVYGETSAFVRDEAHLQQLLQWPVAVIVSEVFKVSGEPGLVEQLGFEDRLILKNAYDSVIRNEDHTVRLWNTLKDWPIERRVDVLPPPGFRDPGKVQISSTMYPKLDGKSSEGERAWSMHEKIERDERLKRQAKWLNREKNDGVVVCEACGFTDPLDEMFDAHHIQPLAVGIRHSRVDDLVVLCPNCHRWAHAKAEDKLSPVPVADIAKAITGE